MPPADLTPCRTRRLREMLGISGAAPAADPRAVPPVLAVPAAHRVLDAASVAPPDAPPGAA